MSHPRRALKHLYRAGLAMLMLAFALLVMEPAAAQSAGSVSVKVVLSGFVDKDGSGTITVGDELDFTTTVTNGPATIPNVLLIDSFTAPPGKNCGTMAPGSQCLLKSMHIVTAQDAQNGFVIDSATATSNGTTVGTGGTGQVTSPPGLSVISGNNQVVTVGVPSSDLVVQLIDNGKPVANATINWNAPDGGSLTHVTTTTDNNGVSRNTVTLHHGGSATVNASSASPKAGPATFTLTAGLSGIAGLTPGEMSVANALDHACPALARLTTLTPAEQDLLAQCAAIDSTAGNPPQIGNVLNQLLPQDTLLQTSASVLVTTAQFDNVKSRLAALRSGTGGDHFGGLAFTTPDGTLPLGSLGDALLGFDDKNDPKQQAGSGFDRWGFFASGSFSRGGQDATAVGTPGYGFHTDGITAGVDYRYSDQLIFGASAGYNNYSSDVDFVGGGMNTHGWSLSAYGTWFRQDNWYLDGVLTYGSNTYDINRRIVYTIDNGGVIDAVNQTATSSSGGHTISATSTFGRDFATGGWSYGPYVRATGTRSYFDAYQENLASGQPGSGLGLDVQSRISRSLEGVLGGKVNYAYSMKWGVMMPHLEAEWVHEFRDNPDTVDATFLQDPTQTPFQLGGEKPERDFFRFGVGSSFVFPHGWSGFYYIERTLGVTGLTQTDMSLGFRMEF